MTQTQHTPGPWQINDAQLRKERLEADMFCSRHSANRSKYLIILDHESEQPAWTIWKSPYNGRWYGSNDDDERVIDAPTLRCAKQDLRLCNFVNNASAAIAKARGEG